MSKLYHRMFQQVRELVLTYELNSADRTISLTGNPTLADWFDQSVKVAASVGFGNLTLFSDYLLTYYQVGASLAFQRQSSNVSSNLGVFAKDGDGTDAVRLQLFAKGLPSDLTNSESLNLKYLPLPLGGPKFVLNTAETGTGTLLPLSIYTGANTTQLVLDVDNSISMSGALAVDSLITGGDIGITADTDLLQLAADALTVNGSLSVTGAFYCSQFLYHLGDSDTGISFETDRFQFVAGGLNFFKIIENVIGADEAIINENGVDINFRVEAVGQANALFVQGSDGKVGIRNGAPASVLDVTGDINTTEQYKVDDVQVVGNRVIDARCDDALNSGDATTDGVIDALRDAMITHGLIAAA